MIERRDVFDTPAGGRTLRDWAQELAPALDVVTASAPEPTLAAGDLVAVFDDPDEARPLVLAWERIDAADQAIGFVALGRRPDRPEQMARTSGADPEGVAPHAAREALRGGLPGALIGAVLVGLVIALVRGWSATVLGGAAGGLVIGFIAGAFVTFVRRTSWGAAYEHSFVDPDATALAVVGFHSDDPDHVEQARSAAREMPAVRLGEVRGDGRVVHLSGWA